MTKALCTCKKEGFSKGIWVANGKDTRTGKVAYLITCRDCGNQWVEEPKH